MRRVRPRCEPFTQRWGRTTFVWWAIFPFACFFPVLYAGLRTGYRRWLWAAGLYATIFAIGFGLAAFGVELGAAFIFAAWIAGLVHAFALRRRYLELTAAHPTAALMERPRIRYWVALGVSLCAIAFGVGAAVAAGLAYRDVGALAHARTCAGPARPGCAATVAATIADRYWAPQRRARDIYGLWLGTPRTRYAYHVTLPWQRDFDRLHEGYRVHVRLWHGNPVGLVAPDGRRMQTTKTPSFLWRDRLFDALAALLFGVPLFLGAQLLRAGRSAGARHSWLALPILGAFAILVSNDEVEAAQRTTMTIALVVCAASVLALAAQRVLSRR